MRNVKRFKIETGCHDADGSPGSKWVDGKHLHLVNEFMSSQMAFTGLAQLIMLDDRKDAHPYKEVLEATLDRHHEVIAKLVDAGVFRNKWDARTCWKFGDEVEFNEEVAA